VLQRLEHPRGTTDGIKVVEARVVRGRIPLREDRDHRTAKVVQLLHERDRLLPADVERCDRARKQHRVANGQDRKLLVEADFVFRTMRVLFFRHDVSLDVRPAREVAWSSQSPVRDQHVAFRPAS
jgi:hypothetical protein